MEICGILNGGKKQLSITKRLVLIQREGERYFFKYTSMILKIKKVNG